MLDVVLGSTTQLAVLVFMGLAVLVITPAVVILILALDGVVQLRAVGDVVVEAPVLKAAISLTLATALVVVVGTLERRDDQCQLMIWKCLQLLICNRHERRQSKAT